MRGILAQFPPMVRLYTGFAAICRIKHPIIKKTVKLGRLMLGNYNLRTLESRHSTSKMGVQSPVSLAVLGGDAHRRLWVESGRLAFGSNRPGAVIAEGTPKRSFKPLVFPCSAFSGRYYYSQTPYQEVYQHRESGQTTTWRSPETYRHPAQLGHSHCGKV